jgi:hypothetical protein
MTTAMKSVPATPARPTRQRPQSPFESGQPDPRPVTDYAIALSLVLGNTRATITLAQPCVIRTPNWAFIDCNTGARIYAPAMTVVDNQTFFFQFNTLLPTSVGFIEVPYQDMQVQNFQGGFVQPGGKWFRKPV